MKYNTDILIKHIQADAINGVGNWYCKQVAKGNIKLTSVETASQHILMYYQVHEDGEFYNDTFHMVMEKRHYNIERNRYRNRILKQLTNEY